MIDTDLYDIEILSSQDLNMVELSNVRQLKQESNYLKYGLLITGISLIGFLSYYVYENNRRIRSIKNSVH